MFVEFVNEVSEIDNVTVGFVKGDKEVIGIHKIGNDFMNSGIKAIKVTYRTGKLRNIEKRLLNTFSALVLVSELLKLRYKFAQFFFRQLMLRRIL